MWHPPKEVAAPSAEPVTVDDVKAHLRVDHDDDDDTIEALITAARSHVEDYTGRVFAPREFSAECTEWADLTRLPVSPVTEVGIAVTGSDGEELSLDDGAFRLANDGVRLAPGYNWPARKSGTPIVVTMTAGSTTPASVMHAMKIWISTNFDGREIKQVIGRSTFDNLLANHRR